MLSKPQTKVSSPLLHFSGSNNKYLKTQANLSAWVSTGLERMVKLVSANTTYLKTVLSQTNLK